MSFVNIVVEITYSLLPYLLYLPCLFVFSNNIVFKKFVFFCKLFEKAVNIFIRCFAFKRFFSTSVSSFFFRFLHSFWMLIPLGFMLNFILFWWFTFLFHFNQVLFLYASEKKLIVCTNLQTLLKPFFSCISSISNKGWSRLRFLATIEWIDCPNNVLSGSSHHHSGVILQKSFNTYVIVIHLKMYILKTWFIECQYFFRDWMRKRGDFHFVSFFSIAPKQKFECVIRETSEALAISILLLFLTSSSCFPSNLVLMKFGKIF